MRRLRPCLERFAGAALVALAALGAHATAAEAPHSRPPAAQAQEKPSDRGGFQIGPEDVLDIAVWNNTAISRTVPVRPDGMISLPLLNDVQASGLTPMELRDLLAARLAAYMPSPEVSVIVREVHSCRVTVMGEVKHPGRYDIGSHATILDAIALAGGFTEFAARSKLMILRPEGRSLQRIPVRYKDAVSGTSDQTRLILKPGDTLVVP